MNESQISQGQMEELEMVCHEAPPLRSIYYVNCIIGSGHRFIKKFIINFRTTTKIIQNKYN